MTVKELKDKLSLKEHCLPDSDREVKDGYAGDLLSWVMGRAEPDSAWLTIMSNANVCAVAVLADLACIILTEGVSPDPELLSRCTAQGINLLSTEESTYRTAARLSQLL